MNVLTLKIFFPDRPGRNSLDEADNIVEFYEHTMPLAVDHVEVVEDNGIVAFEDVK
jgi:hypothetical protein